MSSIQRIWCNTPLSRRPHLDGVLHCLHHLTTEPPGEQSLQVVDQSHLQAIGTQPIDLHQYEQLLSSSG